ncbi:alpha/beta hydrolase family protein [Bacillus sp. NTK034]|uniref:alpha/beta hydrolase family protein n=1 Tax=Bacillus sp. NTK034 TaxID=2802176 RepID=UPI001A903DF1|nr:alpha/beta hydrolase [Bacillus sp. NTK034]MBN8203497.1 alpha/beta hydrolase [Bacillus sp. NTK034]
MVNKRKIYYGEHESQFGVLRMPEVSHSCPVIVLIHGGFWQARYNLEENNPIADDLAQRGYATWNIEYRRVGEEGGGWAGTFNDVIDAVNHLSKIAESYPTDLLRVIVIGHSAGGHLALWLGSRIISTPNESPFNQLSVSIQKIISLAGVTDLEKMWDIHEQKKMKSHTAALLEGSPGEVPKRYKLSSPAELLPMNVEQVLIHGELDRHVPVDLSKDYYKYAIEKGENVKLVILPDIDHFKIIEPTSSAWSSVLDSI